MAIQVFVAEDHPLYRQGLVDFIRGQSELDLVGESSDGREALERIRELKPDIALLDLDLPALDGMDVLKQLRAEQVEARVLMLSAFSEGAIVYGALEAGAAGYLSKSAAPEQICHAIVAASAGEVVLSPGLEQKLARQIGRNKEDQKARLSARESEVLELMADGLSIATICEQLNLGGGTVKSYIQRAYEKLGVSNRAAAVAEAMRRGMLR